MRKYLNIALAYAIAGMDDRIARLVNYINARGSVPSSRLAKELGVSERTIRSYVNRANATMPLSELVIPITRPAIPALRRAS